MGRRAGARPELIGVLGIAAVLNLWALSVNGWANTYYAAAVRAMSTSWHDFLFAAMDKSGLMTVDKPPLGLWIEALSARIFGFHPLSVLVPEALMGVLAVGLLYDLVRRRFGRVAGFAAGLALAVTPTTVAISRHNNPDALLVLCCVAALWFFVKALEDGRTRWLILSGICVGLGFETKMLVAFTVLPAMALAWLWIAPRGRAAAVRQLLAGGAATLAVSLAWPLLVTLTPAADRPWISGTSDNSIWSLIFGYNGLGRISGQTGGPGGGIGGSAMFGGATGPFRLLQSALGDQAGWLLGFAVVAGLALLVRSRLRRRDANTGWLIAVGGSFMTTAVVFSFAGGIFHPYYLSLLAPFTAALIGAGVGISLAGGRAARVIAPLAIAGGAATELAILHTLSGALTWAVPLVIAAGGAGAVVLAFGASRRVRAIALGVAMAALFAAPATWAAETLGHATNGTFPTGGPASALGAGGPGGFGGGRGFFGGGRGFVGGRGALAGPPGGLAAGPPGGFAAGPPGGFAAGPPGGFAAGPPGGFAAGPRGGFGGRAAGGPGGFGGVSSSLQSVISYAKAHGGGTIAVESQSSAAAAIVASNANVAGIGGFSGRESSVTTSWVAMEVASGHLRWVLPNGTGGFGLPGDTRTGSQTAMAVVQRVCRADKVGTATVYDCRGRAPAILQAAAIPATATTSTTATRA